jgi:hypothetical protein
VKPLFVTNVAGARVRLNPMNIIGWALAEVPIGNGKVILGAAIALPDGPRMVRESPEQLDWMFEQATDRWMRPIVTRDQLEQFMADLRAREKDGDDALSQPDRSGSRMPIAPDENGYERARPSYEAEPEPRQGMD